MEQLFEKAEERRAPLVRRLAEEGTDCWRLFHGVAEGFAGLTVDRYGPLVLAQTFREPLEPPAVEFLERRFGPHFFYNHRGAKRDRFRFQQPSQEAVCREFGLKYGIRARHRGLDPHLFLDLRAGRRWVLEEARGKSVINFFSYSCGLGQVAARAGAGEVWNVDFSESALRVGRENLALNQMEEAPVRFVQEDFFPVAWQLSGIGVKGKRARRRFQTFPRRQFDLVLLDPPALARGPFHTVDLVNDYQSLFKPAVLLCSQGGTVMATNNVGSVERDDFEGVLRRCAQKAGRPLRSLEWLVPDDDFPSFDGNHPLKIAICGV